MRGVSAAPVATTNPNPAKGHIMAKAKTETTIRTATPAKKVPAAKPAAAKKPAAPKKAAAAKRKPAVPMAPGLEERYRMIEVAAYYIAERHGFAGDPKTFWAKAEEQIKRLLSK